MAFVSGGKHFGQYTHEHWFDHEYEKPEEAKVDKAEKAIGFFEKYNCAQSVLAAYAGDFGMELNQALRTAVGFGGGMGRVQDVCGAVTGAITALGLASGFTETDGREKINAVYAKVRRLINDFTAQKGTVKCRELLGCDLSSEEGHKYFAENNLRGSNCCSYIRLVCKLLDTYFAEGRNS